MADRSAIEWTDATWNPVTGCTKISPGCAHCYAEAMTIRFGRGKPFLPGRSEIKLHPGRLRLPLTWKAHRRIFVNSMSDLFHGEVPIAFVRQVFDVMAQGHQHVFQILTKRHEQLRALAHELDWPQHVWIGVSVEDQYWADQRIPCLAAVPAGVRFLSVEPLLEKVDLRPYLKDLQWVIVGGESGPKARPMDPDWVRRIRDDCSVAGVPFFFKQWGGRTCKAGGRMLDGRTFDEMPELAGTSANKTNVAPAHQGNPAPVSDMTLAPRFGAVG
ncbi:MAG: phage Gp37/Gp68 family protein [Chloroflexi bacterium]|nr:phage Gp37/Gp68 family protein [Chloroflexota bacterium]